MEYEICFKLDSTQIIFVTFWSFNFPEIIKRPQIDPNCLVVNIVYRKTPLYFFFFLFTDNYNEFMTVRYVNENVSKANPRVEGIVIYSVLRSLYRIISNSWKPF